MINAGMTCFLSLSEKTRVEVIQGDITDYSGVLEASRGADILVHMASLVDVWHKVPESLIYSVNIKGEAPTTARKRRFTSVSIREATNPEERTSCLGGFSRTSGSL